MSLKETLRWHQQAIKIPTLETACVAIGCAYEETGELSRTLDDSVLSTMMFDNADCYKNKHQDIIMHLASGEIDRVQMLDDIVDEIVTRVGIAHNMGFDILGALEEVNRSNFSKLEDGKPVFDANGKITKGKNYVKPNLERFV